MGSTIGSEFLKQNYGLLKKAHEGCVRPYSVSLEEFAESLSGHVAHIAKNQGVAVSSIANEIINQLNVDDYFIALACAKADSDAWDDFVNEYKAFLLATARSNSQSEIEAQELASSAYAELYGLKHSGLELRDSKFRSYSGRGSLKGWLRAVIYQMAIDRFRERARLVQPESDIELERQYPVLQMRAMSVDPSSALAEEYYQKPVLDALQQAFGILDGKDKLLLNYYYFDRLKLREIAGLFDVHEATVSRSLKRIHKSVRKSVETQLRRDYRMSRSEVQQCCEQTVRNLDINLQSFLGGGLADAGLPND
jgi:RNA polymerase sigma-70 factor